MAQEEVKFVGEHQSLGLHSLFPLRFHHQQDLIKGTLWPSWPWISGSPGGEKCHRTEEQTLT